MCSWTTHAVLEAAREGAWLRPGAMILAVSGGLDSMVLLDAMARVARERVAAVATFDHGTGSAATEALDHVRSQAGKLGLPFISERLTTALDLREGREAAWRKARYAFLESVATSLDARLATAHTEDDQLETVLMRTLRGAGARGLAGLYAPSRAERPLLSLRRDAIAAYAAEFDVRWVEDPGNQSREHLRNRVRHDVLPALRAADPDLERSLLSIARAAAEHRRDVWQFVQMHVRPVRRARGLAVPARELHGLAVDSLGMLWPAIAAQAGIVLDRRGTRRLAEFTHSSPTSGSIPLAGGWMVEAAGGEYLLRAREQAASMIELPVSGMIEWGGFRFRVVERGDSASEWCASVPRSAVRRVRRWEAGDRLEPSRGQHKRRVTRYFSEVGVRGSERLSWPVVVSGDDVVWIPGVRRSDAATDRSGGPALHYVCERIDR